MQIYEYKNLESLLSIFFRFAKQLKTYGIFSYFSSLATITWLNSDLFSIYIFGWVRIQLLSTPRNKWVTNGLKRWFWLNTLLNYRTKDDTVPYSWYYIQHVEKFFLLTDFSICYRGLYFTHTHTQSSTKFSSCFLKFGLN